MMTRETSQRWRRSGFLALAVMILMGVFGAAAGMMGLVVAGSAMNAQALELRRQEEALARRLERIAAEAVLGCREPGRGGVVWDYAQAARLQLAELDAGGASLRLIDAPATVLAAGAYPRGLEASLMDPSGALLARSGPELRAMMGKRVAEAEPMSFRFEVGRSVLGRNVAREIPVEVRLVSVPLTRFPQASYELPSEICAAANAGADPLEPGAAPVGLVPGRDPAFRAGLQASLDALPYHYRRRAGLAAAYQDLFSQSFLDRVALAAGITHCLDLDAPVVPGAGLDGLTVGPVVSEWDLGVAGGGSRAGLQARKPLALVVARGVGKTLRLVDSVQNATLAPLVLVLMGPAGEGLRVELHGVMRPVALVAFNLRIQATAGAHWAGALFLDPGSTLQADPGAPLRTAHLSRAASGPALLPGAVLVDQVMPASLEALVPRVPYVAVSRETRL